MVFERFLLHYMAPMTGGIADTQKNRLVFCPGFFKSFGTPWIPAHWIMSVLEQIG